MTFLPLRLVQRKTGHDRRHIAHPHAKFQVVVFVKDSVLKTIGASAKRELPEVKDEIPQFCKGHTMLG